VLNVRSLFPGFPRSKGPVIFFFPSVEELFLFFFVRAERKTGCVFSQETSGSFFSLLNLKWGFFPLFLLLFS